jgi:hypothetical protein
VPGFSADLENTARLNSAEAHPDEFPKLVQGVQQKVVVGHDCS